MASGIDVIDRVLARVGKRVVNRVEQRGSLIVQACSTVRAAPCPTCRCWSGRLHGSYFRQLAERPVLNEQVVLSVETRRFKCLNEGCPRRTFAEDIYALAGRHQRRTRSHARALHALGHALGGEAAARLAGELGLGTSADTVLRELHQSVVTRRRPLPRIVGIDDWAIAKGHHYGTIVVDLERREPIDVFAGREATATAAWLRANPSIRIIARDRAGAYSEAADMALPAATQVSDRWHLLCNLRDHVERMLTRLGSQMRRAAQQVTVDGPTLGRQGLPYGSELRGWQRLSDDRRATRLALYEKVKMLHARGGSVKGIARQLSVDYRTVRNFVINGAFPERARRARGPTTHIGQQLESIVGHVDYLSPMLYPSGFTFGIPGHRDPVAAPYDIVQHSLKRAIERTGLPGARFRPWLQAFRDYAFDRRTFGEREIRSQIDAADSVGTDGWMLWNPNNRYDEGGLEPEAQGASP